MIINLILIFISCASCRQASEQLTVMKTSTVTEENRIAEASSFPEEVSLPTAQDHLLVVEHESYQKVAIPLMRQGIHARAAAIALPGGLLIHGIDRMVGSYYTFKNKNISLTFIPRSSLDPIVVALLSPLEFVRKYSQ